MLNTPSFFNSMMQSRVGLAVFLSLVLHSIIVAVLSASYKAPEIKAVMTTYHLDLISNQAGDQPESNLVTEPLQKTQDQKDEPKAEEAMNKEESERPDEPQEGEAQEAEKQEREEPVENLSDSQDVQKESNEASITKMTKPDDKPSEKNEHKPESDQLAKTELVSETSPTVNQEQSEEQHTESEIGVDQPSQSADRAPAASKPKFDIGSRNNPRPQYPGVARKRGWQGTVVIGVTVGADGRPDKIIIIESSDYGVIDYAAYETVLNEWVFDPAEYLGQPVEGYIEVPITFELR